MIKILHTSDWHIGRHLCGRKRYDEFESFLNWLADTIEREQVDVLLIAGDVFDTSAPSNRAQGLYYRFLCRMAASCCRHIVIISGNHDSPSFLNAPKDLLKAMNIHVIGAVPENREEEVLVLSRKDGSPELIVCAVPYLRDRDIRVAKAGESVEDKERNLIEGIRGHYAEVAAIAEQKRRELNTEIPVIAMGHLFTAGARTIDGDGVRPLYVGTLAHVVSDIFPLTLDYLALGHLHIPQKVGGAETMRYSGSPLPMGFGEAGREKSVCLISFADANPAVSLITVPVFQKLKSIRGTWEEISAAILELTATHPQTWLEIVYEGEEVIGDLRERLEGMIAGSKMEILRITNKRIIDRVLTQGQDNKTLEDLNVHDVFERCMAAHEVPEEQRPELLHAYQEAVKSLEEEDVLAE